MTKIIICDIDGCLIDTDWIWKIINENNFQDEEMWDFFNCNANAMMNKIDISLYKFLKNQVEDGITILFLTARSQEIESATIRFIEQRTGLTHNKHFATSFRASNDNNPPVLSKKFRLAQFLINGNKAILAIDDDEEICKMYESHGIKAYQWTIGMLPVELVEFFTFKSLKEKSCVN